MLLFLFYTMSLFFLSSFFLILSFVFISFILLILSVFLSTFSFFVLFHLVLPHGDPVSNVIPLPCPLLAIFSALGIMKPTKLASFFILYTQFLAIPRQSTILQLLSYLCGKMDKNFFSFFFPILTLFFFFPILWGIISLSHILL